MSFRGKGLAVAALIVASVGFTGCAGPAPTPTPTPSATRTATPAPSVTATPSASPSPSATPTASAEASEGEMTGDQAIEVCLRLHDEYASAGESLVPTGAAQVYDRTVEPHWLVLIPASNSYGPGYIQCILGGTYADPVHTGVGEMVSDIVTDEYIEHTRTVNDGI